MVDNSSTTLGNINLEIFTFRNLFNNTFTSHLPNTNKEYRPILGSMNPETTDEIHVEKWYVATNVPIVSAPKTHPPNAFVK